METSPPSPDDAPTRNSSRAWLFPMLLLLVLGGIVLSNRFGLYAPNVVAAPEAADWTPSPQPAGETVRLEIDFGNGATRQFDALPWQEEMTVADVLTQARDFRPGIRFTQIGTGGSGLLTGIDGLKNEGANARNWLFEVASKPGTKSFCLQKVSPGELVRWRFTDAVDNR